MENEKAKLTEFQLDAIKEICFIGAANAATAVSSMINKKISMAVPKVEFVPISRAPDILHDPEELVAGVYCRILGELSGGFLLTFPRKSADNLAKILLEPLDSPAPVSFPRKRESITASQGLATTKGLMNQATTDKESHKKRRLGFLGEMEKSAILEVGNIVASTFVGALSKITGRSIIISVPQFAFDMLGAVIDFILIEIAEKAEYCLILEIVFRDETDSINGNFFVLPDPDFLSLLLEIVESKKVT